MHETPINSRLLTLACALLCQVGMENKKEQAAKAKIMLARYEAGLCMECGEERHSFLDPCEPILESRRKEEIEVD